MVVVVVVVDEVIVDVEVKSVVLGEVVVVFGVAVVVSRINVVSADVLVVEYAVELLVIVVERVEVSGVDEVEVLVGVVVSVTISADLILFAGVFSVVDKELSVAILSCSV